MASGTERPVVAARGLELRCRGWRQEGMLRMLESTLENGERPADLVIYGGTGQAARDWDSFHTIVDCLKKLADNETLVIQSGKPVGVFRTTDASPRVVVANTQLVGRWATWETFHDLKARGLTMFRQYTAGDWQFIGKHGIVQSTYETLAACAREHFGGTLEGRVFLSSGLGAMGGAQPFAARVLGAVALIVEVDAERAERRHESGYLEQIFDGVDDAVAAVDRALADRRPGSVEPDRQLRGRVARPARARIAAGCRHRPDVGARRATTAISQAATRSQKPTPSDVTILIIDGTPERAAKARACSPHRSRHRRYSTRGRRLREFARARRDKRPRGADTAR
jgi:urocanate hydratase